MHLFFLMWITISANSSVAQTLTFGIVPQQSATKLAKQWQPIIRYLSKESGVTIRFATKASIPLFEKELAQDHYDIAYMNPYHYVFYHRISGYQAIAKAKDKSIKGIMVARKDSNITSMSQLNGQKVAFPSPAAFAATILSQSHLNKNQINYQPTYVRSHDSVYLNVQKGIFIAGGGIRRTFNSMPQSITQDLAIIWESEGFTPHAIAVSKRLPKTVVNKLQQALVKLDRVHPDLLIPLNLHGFEQADNSNWDDVRSLSIGVELNK